MDEMRLHRRALSIDRMLARPMEVELLQLVTIGTNLREASRRDIGLNRVAVLAISKAWGLQFKEIQGILAGMVSVISMGDCPQPTEQAR